MKQIRRKSRTWLINESTSQSSLTMTLKRQPRLNIRIYKKQYLFRKQHTHKQNKHRLNRKQYTNNYLIYMRLLTFSHELLIVTTCLRDGVALWVARLTRNMVRTPAKDTVVNLSKKLYPYCLVLLGFWFEFEREILQSN